MNNTDSETGVITVLVERLQSQRLPKLFAMKQKVENGAPLDDSDLDFL